MVSQDPLSSLNPVFRVGVQVAEPFRRRRGLGRRPRQAPGPRAARAGRHPQRRAPHRRLPPSVLRRATPADHDRHRPGPRADLLIADEPTTALDVTVQAQIMALLADLQRERGMAMMLITHDLGVVADIATRVAIMYAGRIVETGPIRDVYDNPAHPYTEGLLGSIPSEGQPGTPAEPDQGIAAQPARRPEWLPVPPALRLPRRPLCRRGPRGAPA